MTASTPDASQPPAESSSAPPRGTWSRVGYLYSRHVVGTNRENALLLAVAFLATFGVVRFITHSIRAHRLRFLFHDVQSNNGPHIHHMVFGIIGLLIVGYVATAFYPDRRWARCALAVAYGICAALTLDEFAIWLNVKDVYWARQGRESVDAVFFFASLATLGAAGRGFVRALWHDCRVLLRDARSARRRLL